MSAQTFHVEAFIFVIILVIYVLTSHVIENKKVPYLHQSSIAIYMGIITALIAKYVLQKEITFSNDVFFALILPPIIFSAGYSLRKSLFFQNFGMISFLGIIGTVMGFLLLAVFVTLINKLFNALSLTEIIMLSSVLCATDTVAANSLIKVQKFPVLNAVLFGESIINDAVAIILFGTISKLKLDQTGGEFTFKVVQDMFFDFCYLFFFSVAFGTISGFGLSYLFKCYESINQHPIKQASLILLNGYLTYLLGQLMGLSGIITLFTCAIIMGHYSFMNISEQSQKGTGLAFETVGYIAEAFVFSYLGASIFSSKATLNSLFLGVLILLALPVIRAIIVYFLPFIFWLLDKPFVLSGRQLLMCWYSGQIRGVIAFALCLQIESKHSDTIITTALVIVLFTMIAGSSFMQTFAKWIKLEEAGAPQKQVLSTVVTHSEKVGGNLNAIASKYKNIGGYSSRGSHQEEKKEKGTFQNFEDKYLKPIFSKKDDNEQLDMTYSLHESEKKRETDRKIIESQY